MFKDLLLEIDGKTVSVQKLKIEETYDSTLCLAMEIFANNSSYSIEFENVSSLSMNSISFPFILKSRTHHIGDIKEISVIM